MSILTATGPPCWIRRIGIFVICLGLIINGVCLVLARPSTATSDPAQTTCKLVVKVKDKGLADQLVKSIKAEKADVCSPPTVTASQGIEEVPTGEFSLAVIDADNKQADDFSRLLKENRYAHTMEASSSTTRCIYLKDTFKSREAAQKRADMVKEKTWIGMKVIEARRKRKTTFYVIESDVVDESQLQLMKEYVRTKVGSAVVD